LSTGLSEDVIYTNPYNTKNGGGADGQSVRRAFCFGRRFAGVRFLRGITKYD